MHTADYAVARRPSARLSICPFVCTRRYSGETVKHILKLFSPLDSRTILVCLY